MPSFNYGTFGYDSKTYASPVGASSILGGAVPVCYEWRTYGQPPYISGGSGDVTGTSRVFFTPMGPCYAPRLVYQSYSWASTEAYPTQLQTLTLQAAIEYQGTIYQVTFGGKKIVTIDPTATLISDPLGIEIAGGPTDVMWARTYVTMNSGAYMPLGVAAVPLSTTIFGNNGIADGGGINFVQSAGNGSNQLLTAGTAWYSSAFAYTYGPVGVIGTPRSGPMSPVVAIIGDSIADFQNDTYFDGGIISRACFAANLPQIKVALPAEGVGGFLASRRARTSLLENCTHAISNYGTNDLFNGNNIALLKTNALALWQMLSLRGLSVYATTLLPRTTSTDSWVTAGNQTPTTNAGASPNYETYRQAYNAWLRAGVSAGAGNSALYDAGGTLAGVFDLASSVEVNSTNQFSLNGGRWYCGPGNNTANTSDGTHPTTAAITSYLLPRIKL